MYKHIGIWFKLEFLSNHFNYSMAKLDTNNLHTVIWFQVFLSNTNDFQTDLIEL